MAEIDRAEVKRLLRRALRPSYRARYESDRWPVWLIDKVTTLAIFGYGYESIRDYNNPKAIECFRLWCRGLNYDAIAPRVYRKKGTVKNLIGEVLDWIVDSIPPSLLAKIPSGFTELRLGGCPRCSGDLMFDYAEGYYWCLACSRYYDDRNRPVVRDDKMTITRLK